MSSTLNTTPRNSWHRKLIAAGTSLLVAAGLLGALSTPASAGPDDGKKVTTQGHIDSPKSFWDEEKGSFYLRNENRGNTLDPVEDTVIWLGKGWQSNGANKYQFEIPDSPSFDSIGEAGELWYHGPDQQNGNSNPAWVGFGADTGIPVENFRDGTFLLDLLEAKGPGRVETFTYPIWDYPNDFNALLSSTNTTDRSALLHPGTHTHNHTIFERPGRYELTYRTVARGTDGKIIESEPTTQVWQVGGERPGEQETPSTIDRYNNAEPGDLSDANYEFSFGPKQSGGDDAKDGDANLTTLSFNANNESENGTLSVYNNGYFLTDLKVENGQAQWDEFFGSADSNIQAVYTSDTGGARWFTQPLSYSQGGNGSTTSADGEGSWPQEQQVAENVKLPTETYTPSSDEVTASVTPSDKGEGYDEATIEFADKNIRGSLQGGLYSSPEDEYSNEGFNSNVSEGKGTSFFGQDEFNDGDAIKFQFIPHRDMNMRGFQITVKDPYEAGESRRATAKFTITAQGGDSSLEELGDAESDESTPPTQKPTTEPGDDPSDNPPETPKPTADPEPSGTPEPTETSNPSQPPTGEPTDKPSDEANRNLHLLDRGHVDLSVGYADDAVAVETSQSGGGTVSKATELTHSQNTDSLSMWLKDDTGIVDSKSTKRRPWRA